MTGEQIARHVEATVADRGGQIHFENEAQLRDFFEVQTGLDAAEDLSLLFEFWQARFGSQFTPPRRDPRSDHTSPRGNWGFTLR